MTGKERIELAISHKESDVVPFHPYESPEHAMVQCGRKVHEMYMEPNILVEAMIETAKAYCTDIIYPRPDVYLGDKYDFEYDGDYIYFRNKKTRQREKRVLKNTKELIDLIVKKEKTKGFNIEEWKKKFLIPTKIEVLEGRHIPAGCTPIKSVLKYKKRFGNKKFIFGSACAQSANAILTAIGTEDGMIAAVEDPGLCREIMEHRYEQLKVQIDALAEIGIDGVYTGDASASCSFFSPDTYKNLFFEYHKRSIGYIHSKGLKALLHICGRISGILEMMAETGADVIESLDTFTAGGDIDIADAKQRVGDRVCLKGNIDAVHTILPGPPEKVYNACMKALHEAGMNGGYILSTEQITRDTPKEHVLAMIQARDDFSKKYYR